MKHTIEGGGMKRRVKLEEHTYPLNYEPVSKTHQTGTQTSQTTQSLERWLTSEMPTLERPR